MPTSEQLKGEAAWRDERAAPGLVRLQAMLKGRWPGAEIGIRGDNKHLRGYHRSRRWILQSRFATSRSYSVSRTAGDMAGGDENWACALDFGGIPQADLFVVCQRLDVAVKAGKLEKITEWYGNFGGDDRVDGWDNISNRIASSDSSHLSHLHMGFDRGHANDDHSDVFAILTGQGEDDVSDAYDLLNYGTRKEGAATFTPKGPDGVRYGSLSNAEAIAAMQKASIDARIAADAALDIKSKLTAPTPVNVDVTALVAALRPELDAAAERAVRKVLGGLDDPKTATGS